MPDATVPRIPTTSVIIDTKAPRIPETRIFNNAPPIVDSLKPPVIDVPSADIPSYKPIEPPQQAPQIKPAIPNSGGGKESEEKEEGRDSLNAPDIPVTGISAKQPRIEIPFTDYSVPVPSGNEIALAGTTAVAATAVALIGRSLVEHLVKIMKPFAKKALLSAKAATNRDLTPYELQMYFEFEGKEKLTKLLEKEQRLERRGQAEEWAILQQRQRTQMHTENPDESEHRSSSPLHTGEVGQAQNQDELYQPQLSDE